MLKTLAIAALTATIATAALVQSTPSEAQNSVSSGTKAKKNTAAKRDGWAREDRRVSPSGNPEWDVYVRGEYVGSDPDPRIRWTLRSEATRNYGLRGN